MDQWILLYDSLTIQEELLARPQAKQEPRFSYYKKKKTFGFYVWEYLPLYTWVCATYVYVAYGDQKRVLIAL